MKWIFKSKLINPQKNSRDEMKRRLVKLWKGKEVEIYAW